MHTYIYICTYVYVCEYIYNAQMYQYSLIAELLQNLIFCAHSCLTQADLFTTSDVKTTASSDGKSVCGRPAIL